MDQADHNPALEEARQTIGSLPQIQELANEVYTYPLSLLRQVCEETRSRGGPVPDHILRLPPYLGETSLRALMDGGLIERIEDQQFAIHAYKPTSAGQAIIDKLDASVDRGGRKQPPSRSG